MKSLLLSLLLIVSGLGMSLPVKAEANPANSEPETSQAETEAVGKAVPQDLQDWVRNLDSVANDQRLSALLKNYDRSFRHADGFDRKQFGKDVKAFWSSYSDLSYTTKIESWERKAPNHYITRTTTTIEGKKTGAGENIQQLTATVTTEQDIVDAKITRQTTLQEQSVLRSGTKPPQVRINLPDTVTVGSDYFLDIILEQPLGDRILLGTAIEEKVSPSTVNPPKIQLEPLATGGLFKIGTAPESPTDEWISAILIQDGGTLIVSQRLSVVEAKTGSNP